MKRYPKFAEYFNVLLDVKEHKATQEEVAGRLGISQGALSRMKNGMLAPSEELAKKIAEIWGVEDLVEMARQARQDDATKVLNKAQPTQEAKVSTPTKPRLPVSAAAGKLSDYSTGVLLEQCEQVPIIRDFPDYDYTMFIKGNSMEPKYESGDEIAIKKITSVIEWGKDYVLDTEDGIIFKKIYDDGDKIRCVSYNHEEYPDFLVPKDIIYGFYKFVGLVRV